jgi:glucosyl-3-phosphoglycerate synthase
VPFRSASEWQQARSFHHSRFAPELLRERRERISVCLPARNCAGTVGTIVERLCALRADGLIDEVVVIDGDSTDATASVAERAGATVYEETSLLPDLGAVLGKGDAMWRALSVLDGELICFLDADIEDFSPHFVTGLLGPLLESADVDLVKAYYRRPFRVGELELPEGGGRVNHLLARPALAIFYPELAGVRQPLAGEIAGRTRLLERLPFVTGYGVEIAMLLDAWQAVGLDGLAQVDLDLHHNAHQPLAALSVMAYEVLYVIAHHLERDGRLRELDPGELLGGHPRAAQPPVERPPMVSMR